MNEDYLQYVWRWQRLPHGTLTCTSGRELTVMFQGHWNRNAGPDFLEARLRIEREQWVGSVEVHVKASDWRRHKHSDDPAYDNVVLHVVYENDEPLINTAGQEVPTLELRELLDATHWNNYLDFMTSPQQLSCARGIDRVSTTVRDMWLHRMGIERFTERCGRVEQLLYTYKGDWNAVWWHSLCRAFGFGINREAYEQLGASLPWQVVTRIAARPKQLEALFAVHSGWQVLDRRLRSDEKLVAEYGHLQKLLGLTKAHPAVWYRGRMKPANHPRVRLGQLAALVHHSTSAWSKIVNAESLNELRSCFGVTMSAQVLNLKAEAGHTEPIGQTTIDLLIANAVLPLLFQRARMSGEAHYTERIIDWMEELPAENNKYTRLWSHMEWPARNLLESQGQLHLFTQYCTRKKCLSCSVGVTLLNNA